MTDHVGRGGFHGGGGRGGRRFYGGFDGVWPEEPAVIEYPVIEESFDDAGDADTTSSGLEMGMPHAPSAADEINDATDDRFWNETGYKPGQKLDMHDPHDKRWINKWLAIRYEIAQEYAMRHADSRVASSGIPGLAVIMGRGGGGGGGGGGRGFRFQDDPTLMELAPVIAAGWRGARVTIDFDRETHVVTVTACIDGRCYTAHADLSVALAMITEAISNYHHALHGNPGAATALAQVATEANHAIQTAGEALVGAVVGHHASELCGSWWHDLTHKVKSAVHSVVHEVSHPDELAKDVSHYALHPSDAIAKAAQGLGAGAGLAKALSYAVDPLQDLTENAQVQQMAASMYGGPAGAAALQAAQGLAAGKGIAATLTNLAPQIASTASGLAGQYGGPAAASLASSLVSAAAGTGSMSQVAQQAVNAATQAAASDPAAKAALDAAHQAVSHATVAYHTAQTMADAAAGDAGAASQIAELTQAAAQGDPAAQQLTNIASDVSNLVSTAKAADAAVSQGIADLRSRGAEVAHAAFHPQVTPAYIGVQFGGQGERVRFFPSLDHADDWFGQAEHRPHIYIAYYDATDPTWPMPINESTGPEAETHVGGFLPMMFAGGAGFAGGAYFWPALREKLAKRFPKAFGGAK